MPKTKEKRTEEIQPTPEQLELLERRNKARATLGIPPVLPAEAFNPENQSNKRESWVHLVRSTIGIV